MILLQYKIVIAMNILTFEKLPDAISQLLKRVEDLEVLIKSLQKNIPEEQDEFLTIEQTSKILSLSVPTIYGLVSRTEIPVLKRGKRLYFSKQEIFNWIKQGRKKTWYDLKNEAHAGYRK